MLKTIEPRYHDYYGSSIDSLLSFLKIYQGFYLSEEDQEKAAFIIAEDEERDVYGGAVLYKQKVPSLHEKIGKVITSFEPERENVWVAQLCLCIDYDESFLTLETLELCQTFYLNLYDSLRAFGEKKGVDFLVLTLRPTDYFYSKIYGCWPYILEIKPREVSDNRFHGLLAVNNEKKKVFDLARRYFSLQGEQRVPSLTLTQGEEQVQ